MVSQNVIPGLGKLGGARPMVFTEQGVAMLSSVLCSRRAVQVNIAIMRAFVRLLTGRLPDVRLHRDFNPQPMERKPLAFSRKRLPSPSSESMLATRVVLWESRIWKRT